MTRARKDGAKVLTGKAAALGVGTIEDEELVAAGSDTALDAEEVAESGPLAVRGRAPIVLGVAGVDGPLTRVAQLASGIESPACGALRVRPKVNSTACPRVGGSFAEDHHH